MASRRKTTTPCMRLPQEAVDSDPEMDDVTEAGEDGRGAAAEEAGPCGEEEEGEEEEEEGATAVLDHCTESNLAEGGYECKYCSFQTSELKLFTLHVDNQHPHVILNASYVCVECDFHTKRYDALQDHNVRFHPGEDSFTRTMVKRNNQTVFQQTVNDLTFHGSFLKMEDDAEEEGGGACRGIALSKTPIMRLHRRTEPKKFASATTRVDGAAGDVIKLESDEDEDTENMEPPPLSPAPLGTTSSSSPAASSPAPRLVAVSAATHLQVQQGIVVNSPGVLQIKTGSSAPATAVLPPGTLAQVLSAFHSQQSGGQQHNQLLIPLSSIPTYNGAMDNNVLLVSAYNRFPYPTVSEIMGLSSQTKFGEEQIKVWFSAQRLKHGVSWTPEEVEEARRKKFNGTVQAVPQTITVIPANIATATNGLQSIFQTCQIMGQSGLVLTQVAGGGGVPVASPITLVAGVSCGQPKASDPSAAEAKSQTSASALPGTPPGGSDPPGSKPKKSKEQLAELKSSYGRRQFATEAEISRLMRVTNLTKRAIKKWFSDTRYNQRNSKEHHGPGAPSEAPAAPAAGPGVALLSLGGGGVTGNANHVTTATIVIDSSDDASDCSPTSANAPASSSDPRVKFRHAFPDFTPQKFKEKTSEQLLVLEASFQGSPTPSDDELSRLRTETKLTRREVDAWFTERRKMAAADEPRDPDGAVEKDRSPATSSSGATERQATPPATRKVLKKTPEQLHILKMAFVRTQWPTPDEYHKMAEESGLPRSYIVNWFGDTRYACKNSSLKWYYLYQSGKVEEALNGGPVKTHRKSRKRFRGWSRRTRRPYPRRPPQEGAPAIKVKAGQAFLKDHYRKQGSVSEKDLDELVSKSCMSYQQVRDWFSQAELRAQQGREAFSEEEEEEEEEEDGGEGEGTHADSEGDMEVREEGEEASDEEESRGEEEAERQDEAEPVDEEEEEEEEKDNAEAVGPSQQMQEQT